MVITIFNQKGGVTKTTTTLSLGSGLAKRGYKVLLIDLDAQFNLTACTNADFDTYNIYDLLFNDASFEDTIQNLDEFDMIIGTDEMALVAPDTDLFVLKNKLDLLKDKYDFIILDTPPGLGITPISALTASDGIVIPVLADKLSVQALSQVNKTILDVIRNTNSKLKIIGIIPTIFEGNTIVAREMEKEFKTISRFMDTKVFKSYIRKSTAIKESQVFNMNIYDYAPKSNAAQDYNDFVDEFLERVKKNG